MADVVAVARALRQLHDAGIVPDYERVLTASYGRFLKAGDVVFDVGAHSGRHLANYAALVGPSGKVFAFEPLPHLAKYLNSQYSGDSRIRIHEVALSAKPGETQFTYAPDAPEESGILARIFNKPGTRTQKIKVRLDTLDRVAEKLDRLDYVKIDIEGGEIDCLRGGAETIARLRPILSIEYGHPAYSVYGHTNMTLHDWASGAGYLLSDLFGNVVETPEQWATVCDHASWDYFAIPQEKTAFWAAAFAG